MAVQKIQVEELLELSTQFPVLDVRSPGEYSHAQIPGAHSFPIFSDEERKIIGTAYKKESREKAIKLGLDFFGIKMRPMVEEAEKIIKANNPQTLSLQPSASVIVHCWRGGMRSAAVAWLLNLYGIDVYLLEGGYKAYRNWVLQQFEKDHKINILAGYTGSGKTELLKAMQQKGYAVIDLEAIASHKGSAFGSLGQAAQPTQEMFENILAQSLYQNSDKQIWLEDESQRIGSLNIPHGFWRTMRSKPVYFIDIPFEERLDHICSGYGSFDKDQLIEAIERIKKRLGPMETKTAVNLLKEGNITGCFWILLTYYDKSYQKALNNRENLAVLLNKIGCSSVDTISNIEKLASCATSHVSS